MPTGNAPIWLEIREDEAAGVVRAWLVTSIAVDNPRIQISTLSRDLAKADRPAFDAWVGVLSRHVEGLVREVLANIAPEARVIGSKRIEAGGASRDQTA